MARVIHPVEAESYRILRGRIDLSHLPPLSRSVAERVIHSCADLDYAATLVLDEAALQAGRAALLDGAPLVCDAAMVAAGITALPARVALADPRAAGLAEELRTTRSAAAFRLTAQDVGPGAVWVVGNAPTALLELLELDVAPALVVGLPVGFVGAAESKAALAASGLPCVTNRGERGGSAAAAAAVNALLYHEEIEP